MHGKKKFLCTLAHTLYMPLLYPMQQYQLPNYLCDPGSHVTVAGIKYAVTSDFRHTVHNGDLQRILTTTRGESSLAGIPLIERTILFIEERNPQTQEIVRSERLIGDAALSGAGIVAFVILIAAAGGLLYTMMNNKVKKQRHAPSHSHHIHAAINALRKKSHEF